MTKAHTSTIESLLTHADWVRALAARLVHDPSLADDVTQRTYEAALERPPRDQSNPRAWLARVATNAARQLGRAQSRRHRREHAAARNEATDSTLDVVARANLQRELVGEVVALDDPYRTTLLLHFFEGLAPRAIGERMSCSVDTVRTRLRRGLDQLRLRLDGRYGDRSTWCATLLPLASAPRVAAGLAPLLFVGAALALAAFGLRALAGEGARPEALTATSTAPAAVELLADAGGSAREARGPEEHDHATSHGEAHAGAPVAPVVPGAKGASVAPTETFHEHGQVLDPFGTPLPGFTGTCGGARFEAGGDGRFEVVTPKRLGEFVSTTRGWTLVVARRLTPDAADGWGIVAARTRHVAGRVVDAEEAPVAGARVRAQLPNRLASLEVVLYGPFNDRVPDPEDAVSDTFGRFEFEALADVTGQRLSVAVDDDDAAADLPEGDVDEVVLRLGEPEVTRPYAEGLVLDAGGAPVAGAEVRLAWHEAKSDALGRFRVSTLNLHRGYPLTAHVRGRGAGAVERFSDRVLDERRDVHELDIVLAPAHGELRLRVVDADGVPAAGFEASLIDGTVLGSSSSFVEDEVAPRGVLAGTDAEGRLVVGGLFDRPYRVRLHHRDGRFIETAPLAPSLSSPVEEVLVTLPADPFLAEVSGRVLDLEGSPVAGATVSILIPSFDSRALGIEYGHATKAGLRDGTHTDTRGYFVLRDVPRGAIISVAGELVHNGAEAPAESSEPLGFEVVALRRLRFPDGTFEPGDRLEFRTADDGPVAIAADQGNTTTTTYGTLTWTFDRSPVFRIEQTATTLRVRRGGQVLAEVALALSPGAVEVIHPW